jgi:alpha/beta superfamily hydrolase
MVLAGQYLERSVVVRSGELTLDGLYHRGSREPACVLASPHPALGGSMTAPVIAELAWALTRAGHATLRFDYRGVGASQGTTRHAAGSLGAGAGLATLGGLDGLPRLDDEVEDLLAAAEQLRATAGASAGGLCAVGYSFGAAVVLRAARDPRIGRIVLVAPPNAIADFSALRGLEKPTLLVCAHHDDLCDRALLQPLLEPDHAALEVVAHADHSFRRGLTELGKLCAAWLRGGLPEPAASAPGPGLGGEQHAAELELEPGDGEPLELDD